MSLLSRKLFRSSSSSCSIANTKRLTSLILRESYSSTTTTGTRKRAPKNSEPPQQQPKLTQPPTVPSPPDKLPPKPSEIAWQPKVVNTINLVGHVKFPVQFETVDNKCWATTIINQEATSNAPPFWIPLIFEGDLAHIARGHLKVNDYICIHGQLSADPPPFPMHQGEARFQVQVQDIKYVQKPSFAEKKLSHEQNIREASYSVGAKHPSTSWNDLVNNPLEWKDHRKNKLSGLLKPKHPDFKRIDGSVSLWLNDAPAWVLPQLEVIDIRDINIQQAKQVLDESNVNIPQTNPIKRSQDDDKWKELLENPSKWWDNRTNKLNVKSPDFKHKNSGDALWLNRAPSWVHPKLPPQPPAKPTILS